jgi:hypothetical protein
LDVNRAISQRPAAAANTNSYLRTNAGAQASNTNLNLGITVYNDGFSVYGMDLGYSAATTRFRTRIFADAAADISFSTFSHGSLPTGQSAFTDDLVIRGDSGNVGIGTTAPASLLDVTTANNVSGIRHTANGVVVSTWADSARGGFIGTLSNNDFGIYTNSGGAQLTVETSGNVGIGTTAPSSSLSVSGDISTGGGGIKWKRFNGTTSITARTTFAHGLDATKIISVQCNLYVSSDGYYYNMTYWSSGLVDSRTRWSSTNINIMNDYANSFNQTYRCIARYTRG